MKILNENSGTSQDDISQFILENKEDILIDIYFDYYFIDDFSMTKYVAKNTAGQIKLWGFDYVRSFPISIRPTLVAYCSNRELLSEFCEETYSVFKGGKSLSVEHPTIKGYTYSIRPVASGLNIVTI